MDCCRRSEKSGGSGHSRFHNGRLIIHNTVVETALKALLIAALVSFNALFVAAEYALLSVRRTRIEELAREGQSNARLAQSLLADMGVLFSGLQLGITIASVLMGWLGESILSGAIEGLLENHLQYYLSIAIAHTIAITVSGKSPRRLIEPGAPCLGGVAWQRPSRPSHHGRGEADCIRHSPAGAVG